MAKLFLIHALQHIELHPLKFGSHFRILDVTDGRLFRRNARVSDGSSLERRRQEGTGPILNPAMPQGGTNADKSWQALVLSPKPVSDPRTHAWSYKSIRPRMEL